MMAMIRTLQALPIGVGYIAALLLLPLLFATGYEVFSRYALNAPTYWAFELGYMMMGAHFMLGGALTLQRGSHVRIDFLYERFSDRHKALVDGVVYLVLLLPCLVLLSWAMVEWSYDSFLRGERTGHSAWNPAIWPFRAVLTISFIVLVMQVAAEILKCVAVLRGAAPEEVGR